MSAVCAWLPARSNSKSWNAASAAPTPLAWTSGIISPVEALKIMPQISKENLYGAIYLPRDGQLDPYTTTTSMARLAREMGVEVLTSTRVTGIELIREGEYPESADRQGLHTNRDRGERGRVVGTSSRCHGWHPYPDHTGGSSTYRLEGSCRQRIPCNHALSARSG